MPRNTVADHSYTYSSLTLHSVQWVSYVGVKNGKPVVMYADDVPVRVNVVNGKVNSLTIGNYGSTVNIKPWRFVNIGAILDSTERAFWLTLNLASR